MRAVGNPWVKMDPRVEARVGEKNGWPPTGVCGRKCRQRWAQKLSRTGKDTGEICGAHVEKPVEWNEMCHVCKYRDGKRALMQWTTGNWVMSKAGGYGQATRLGLP